MSVFTYLTQALQARRPEKQYAQLPQRTEIYKFLCYPELNAQHYKSQATT